MRSANAKCAHQWPVGSHASCSVNHTSMDCYLENGTRHSHYAQMLILLTSLESYPPKSLRIPEFVHQWRRIERGDGGRPRACDRLDAGALRLAKVEW
jgi:hypothetical protein